MLWRWFYNASSARLTVVALLQIAATAGCASLFESDATVEGVEIVQSYVITDPHQFLISSPSRTSQGSVMASS